VRKAEEVYRSGAIARGYVMDNAVMDNASEGYQTQVEPAVNTSNEKLLPQSQVNEIVGNAKREAAERAVDAYKRQQAQSSTGSQAQSQTHEPSSHRNMSEDDIKRFTGDEIKRHFTQIEQEAQERANVDAAHRVVGQFRDKVMAGKDKFEDFESVTSNVAMQYYPNVVSLLAEHVDNTADVLYHLAKNRDKLYRLEALSSHNGSDAIYEIKRLADSIKSNDEGVKVKHPNSPLSQQRPSNTGTDSGGTLSMSDLKRKYRG
jgi:hypothetical protein